MNLYGYEAMRKISVVLTTKNEENNIRDLLENLMDQEGPYEVIVVDSDSTDKTRDIVEEFSKKNKKIKLFNYPGTRAESMNYGIQQATGEAIAFIGGDDIADKNWIREIRKGMRDSHIIVGDLVSREEDNFENIENVKLFHKGTNISYPGTNTVYKKEVLDHLGGFDPWFSSAEDLEINLRAVDAGYKITRHKDAKVYYRPKNSPFGFIKQSFWYGYGRKLMDLKHGDIWEKHSAKDVVKSQISFLGIIRLTLGFLGYIYCIAKVKSYSKNQND